MTFLMNTWYVAAIADEVSRQPLGRMLLNQKVVMYRGEDGRGIALGNVCPHRFAFLSKGRLVGEDIECPYHGLRFGPDGKCSLNPHGDGAIPPHAKVAAYPFVERHGVFWIWMGDAEQADAAAIPDCGLLDQEGFAAVSGSLKIQANYQLIIDNLMDLSHIQFLHPMLSTPDWIEKRESVVTQEPGVVYCTNRARDCSIFPIDRIIKPDALPVGEEWLDLRWTAPSNVLLDVRYMTSQEQMLHPIGHFLTPETEDQTHYFFRSSRNQRPDDEELSANIAVQLKRAFATEDEPMIEDQQLNLGGAELMSLNPVILQSDNAAVRVRRMMSQMIKSEAADRMQAKGAARRADEVV